MLSKTKTITAFILLLSIGMAVYPCVSSAATASQTVHITILEMDTTPPSAPQNLTATAVSPSQINLSWNVSTDNVGVTGYKIYRDGVLVVSLQSSVVSYSDTGLAASTAYSYTVSAFDAAGNESGKSSPASATSFSTSEIIPADRRIDWSPGIPGGIPNRTTICANVRNTPYSAAGDGIADDTQAIQTAVNNCPIGQVVYIPEGIYKTTNQLVVSKGIVLRGDGPAKTKIKLNTPNTSNVIRLYQPSKFGPNISITSGYEKDSTIITVQDAASLAVNDYIILSELNKPGLVTINSYSGSCTYCGLDNGTRTMTQIVQIIAKNGNTLTLNRPLYFTFEASLDPIVRETAMMEGAGIEDLYVEQIDPNGSYAGSNNIDIYSCSKCWVKNTESYKPVGAHIKIQNSYANEIRENYVHEGHAYGSGRTYGIFLMNTNSDHLIENNIIYKTRHSIVLEGGGSGNVFGYNYAKDVYSEPDTTWLSGDMNTHGAHPYMNLFEGNIFAKLEHDITHGSGSHNTSFRNHITRNSSGMNSGLFAVDIHVNNYYINLVGNIICSSGCTGTLNYGDNGSRTAIYKLGYSSAGDNTGPDDLQVENTLLRHGNYDYFTNSTIWDSNIPDQNIPASLYLSAKPAFFGNKPWPLFGPDVGIIAGTLSAEDRFNQPLADTTPPSVPTNLTAAAISSTQIDLSWSASTDDVGVTGYKVYRDGALVVSLQSSVVSHSDTGLMASTAYSYTVTALDAAGNESAMPGPASATTQSAPDTMAPSVPTGLTATAVSSSQINLAWNASTDDSGVVAYNIYRDGGMTPIASSASASYSDTELSSSTTYSYTIRAFDLSSNLSNPSASASAMTQPAITTQNNIYYVDFDNGNDANSGTSQSSPWKTIPGTRNISDTSDVTTNYGGGVITTSNRVQPGTVFKLKGGTTHNSSDGGYIQIKSSSGGYYLDTATNSNPIKFEVDNTWGSGPVVIDGAGMTVPIALILIRSNGIHWNGITPNGIIIQNSTLAGVQYKEKGSGDPAVYDISVKNMKFYNNGTNCVSGAECFTGQLHVREGSRITIDNVELDGDGNHIQGIYLGEANRRITEAAVSHSVAYNHVGDNPPNDSGIGFKAHNGQVTFTNIISHDNEKGFDLGQEGSQTTWDITYKVVNANVYNNEYGVNYNVAASIGYAGNVNFYLVNSIVRDNTINGSRIYAGPYNLYMVHNVFDNNGNTVNNDRSNITIAPGNCSDESTVNAYLYNNIFYKPNVLSGGMNYQETYIGNAAAGYDTHFNLYSDHNSWVQKGSEYFARWSYYNCSQRYSGGLGSFLYGANGPGHASGQWYTDEDEPGNGFGHLNADPNSKGTGATDTALPPFADVINHDYTLTANYAGADLSGKSWYIPEMGIDRAGKARAAWDIGAYEYLISGPSVVEFYVDPDWTGVKSGTQNQPWPTLDNAAWTTINNSLTNSDVTIYFSAREATVDTVEEYGNNLEVKRTDNSPHRLTLDGMSKYNASDASPWWQDYGGTQKFKVIGKYSLGLGWQGSSVQNNITLRGFEVTGDSARVLFGGNNLVIEHVYSHDTTNLGPAFHMFYATNPEGSCTETVGRFSNVIIRNNTIDKTYGEALYIGGTNNCPSYGNSHSDILIEDNTITNAGANGAQGDGIDLKDGLVNVIVRNNTIMNSYNNGINVAGIYGGNQNLVIEKNRISAGANHGILLSTNWGDPNGIAIRNNLIYANGKIGISVSGNSSVDAIYNAGIHSNTVYKNGEFGISFGNVNDLILKNNLVMENNNSGNQVSSWGSSLNVTSDYNLWFPKSGYSGDGANSFILTDTSSLCIDPLNADFRLKQNSPAIDKGVTVTSFNDDFIDTPRPQGPAWDIGAYEY